MKRRCLIPLNFLLAKLLSTVVMLCVPALSEALRVSDFTFSHFDMEDGLTCQRIYSLRQTPDGAIWFSTKNGVARYNGSDISNYSLTRNSISHSLVGHNVCFVQSSGNELQVYDAGGCIYQYNAVQNRFDVVADVTHLFKNYNQLNDVCKDGDTYWLAMSAGVYQLRGGKVERVYTAYTNKIIRGANGNLLFATRQGVKLLSHRYKNHPQGHFLPFLPFVGVSGFYDIETKRLWLGTYNQGLVMNDEHGNVSVLKGVPHRPIRDMVVYNGNTLLVGVDGAGVFQLPRQASATTSASLLFSANEGANGVLHGNGIYALLVDRWQNIFIGSYSGGIDVARPMGSTAAIYQHQRGNMQSLINDHVNSVAQLPSKALMMGTDDGISILNPTTGLWTHTARGMIVLSMCTMPDGRLYVATYGNGVCEVDAGGYVKQLYGKINGTLDDDNVFDLLVDRKNHLWVGCQDGRLTEVTPTGIRYYPVDNVQSLALLPDDRIAVGTIKGLFIVDSDAGTARELHYFSNDTKRVNRYILDLFIYKQRYIYIATDGGGVYVYDLRTHTCRHMSMANGLPSNIVTGIVLDNLDRLWFSTDRGLAFIQADNPNEVIDVNYCYGFRREYIFSSALKLLNGNLLLGSTSGAVVVNPHDVQQLDYKAQLRITRVVANNAASEAFNRSMFKMLRKGRLSLPYSQRNFELNIECINLRYQYDIGYQYKVGNAPWSPMTTQQSIRFVNLEPGTHHLYIRAVSKTGHVELDRRELVLSIGQPWWNTWWMWCIYITLIVMLFYFAWWTYGLHNRYMRLALNTLEQDKNLGLPHAQANTEKEDEEKRNTPGTSGKAEPRAEEHRTDEKETNPAFVDMVTKLILEHLSDSEFTIDQLCREMAMSRTLFYIKLKSYTGKSPQEFIRVIRLERAAALLRDGHHVGDVASAVGFNNEKYFSTVFKKYFNVSPSKYR